MSWREALAEYLARRLPSASSVEVVNVQGMPAGASNDTVSFDARVRAGDEMVDLPLVLRPQRPDGILAPYDVSMQFRVMRALSRTEVPVPAVAWFEPDLTVLGVPFFIMERVAGETLPLFWYGRSPRLDAGAAALAAIHAVDWRQAGLHFLLPSGTAAVTPSDSELAPWRARAERLRIARELHDETAQALASLLVRQRVAERSPDAESLQRTMADLRVLTSEALEGVRRMALELRPTMLDDLGLVAAVEAFARQFSHRTGIPVDVRMTRRPERLPPEVELVAFRVIQEALSNVARHSGASRAEVRLGAGQTVLVISIEDDGSGFQLETALDSRRRSLGLFGMHERAALVGGRLSLDAAPGRGTRVRLEIPTEPPA